MGLKRSEFWREQAGRNMVCKGVVEFEERCTSTETKWLRSTEGNECKLMRKRYLEIRKAVKRAKRAYDKRRRDQLEQDLQCPKKFWKAVKKMHVCNK